MNFTKNQELLEKSIGGDEKATSELMEANMGLVRSIALRFRDRGVEYEDLIQIGCIGMLKAIRSFDSERGTVFSTYAVPLIIGEIRRFIRDDGLIKVSRIYKQQGALLMREREKYLAEYGTEPTIEALAKICNLSVSDAVIALDASSPVNSLSASLSGDDDGFTLEDTLSSEKNEIEEKIDHIALAQIIKKLPPLWRQIVTMRYLNEYSQQKTAELLGITQVKVSREEKKIIEAIRKELL